MNVQDNLLQQDIHEYLRAHEEKDLLRFITCGNVDDGKSTLIGRLLHDTKMIYEDQLAAITADSKNKGTVESGVDLALLVDGLQSEREQGITIDVAYRYFSTDKRKFIIADTPGHEQYTRNMATGASTADLAVLLIDARYGVQIQTRRHSFICSLLGIKNFVIAINKMDLVGFSEEVFTNIKQEYLGFSEKLTVPNIIFIPMSALTGENVVQIGASMPWYAGDSFLSLLENVDIAQVNNSRSVRFPVQYVNRPNQDFRGYCGTLAAGEIFPGMKVKVLPSGKVTGIDKILRDKDELAKAVPGEAITVILKDEIDISRGDMIVSEEDKVEPSNSFIVDVVWMHDSPLEINKAYKIKIATSKISGAVVEIMYKVNVNTLEQEAATTLNLNEIGRCRIQFVEKVVADAYRESRLTGGLIFIDRLTNVTVGAGMVVVADDSQNIVWHKMDVSKKSRAQRFNQKAAVVWFTGLSGSGKSTSANALERQLFAMGYNTYLLDGDNVRHGLCSDLGFSERDRAENIRRVGEVAKLMVDAGLIVLVSFISPFRRERQTVRQMLQPGEFLEVYVNTPINVCESRDPKGLYKKARAGEIRNFTGIDSPYEAPESPEIELNTANVSMDEVVRILLGGLQQLGILPKKSR
jgi:bifunctional enzyme CysN/CysC